MASARPYVCTGARFFCMMDLVLFFCPRAGHGETDGRLDRKVALSYNNYMP